MKAPFLITRLEAARIFNLTPDGAGRKLQKMKKELKKPLTGYVTINEFCSYFALPLEEVTAFLEK